MAECTTLATYAVTNGALAKVVEQINQELARLQRLSATIDPLTVRFSASAGEFGTTYVGSFVYAQPIREVEP